MNDDVRRIVLVEDDEDDYVLTRDLLAEIEGSRFDLQWVPSYGAALEALHSAQADVYLVDYRLGDRNGIELLREASAADLQAPIIVLTGQGDRDVDLLAMKVGAADYLVKGEINAPMLERSIRYAIERKRAEDAIRQLNADLERRVVERTAQLQALNKELEAFSYSVSHDLRAPLRSISGFAAALAEDYGDRLDAQAQDYIQRVRAAAETMGEMIDALLDLARLSRGELHLGVVNLSTLAHALADELKRSDPQRPVEFVIADGVMVEGDARLLRTALQNLLGNAWKFTGKRPAARIEFGRLPHSPPPSPMLQAQEKGEGRPPAGVGGEVFFVRDDGAGFNMAHANRLFIPFQRLHPQSDFEGHGIGLATVQRIIRRHGGRLWAEGAVGKGATFYFTLS